MTDAPTYAPQTPKALARGVMLLCAPMATEAGTHEVAAVAQSAFVTVCTQPFQSNADVLAAMKRHSGLDPLPFEIRFFDTTMGDSAPVDARDGINRMCLVTYPGDHSASATRDLIAAMEGPPVFGAPIALPTGFAGSQATRFLEARQLNPRTQAVVEVGVLTEGPQARTFLKVERLAPQ